MMNWTTCCLLLLGAVLSTQALSRERYPQITVDTAACWNHTGPIPNPLRLCDPDRIVNDIQAVDIQNDLNEIRALKACPCRKRYCDMQRLMGRDRGYTVTVALVKTMGPNAGVDKIAAARNYTIYLRSNRGYFGREFSRCQDDIIVFVSFEEKVVYVLTGITAMSTVTNQELQNMIAASEDSFRQVADGVRFLLAGIKREIEKEIPTEFGPSPR